MSVAQLNIHGSLVRSVAPTSEPLTPADADVHARISSVDETAYVSSLITLAREIVEEDAEVSIMSQTWVLYLDCFPDVVELRRPTVQPGATASISSVSSVAYVDTAGDSQTLSSSLYRTDLVSRPARIVPAYGQSWPTIRDVTNAVTVTFVAGHSSAATVPETAKHAIRLLVKNAFDVRGDDEITPTMAQSHMAVAHSNVPHAYWSLIDRLRWRPSF